MRTLSVVGFILMTASAAVAADVSTMQLSILTSNLEYGQSNGQSQWSGGAGVALSRSWSPSWSTELAVAAQRGTGDYTVFEVITPEGPAPMIQRRSFTVFPVDLTTQYRFVSASRWTPYVTAGARYVAAPPKRQLELTPGVSNPAGSGWPFRDRTSAEIGVGAAVRITPRVGLRFEAVRLLRSDEVHYDPLMRTSFGLSYRF